MLPDLFRLTLPLTTQVHLSEIYQQTSGSRLREHLTTHTAAIIGLMIYFLIRAIRLGLPYYHYAAVSEQLSIIIIKARITSSKKPTSVLLKSRDGRTGPKVPYSELVTKLEPWFHIFVIMVPQQ